MCLGDGSHGSSCGEAPSDCIFPTAQALYKRLVFSSGFEIGWLVGAGLWRRVATRTRCCARIATFSSGSSRSCSPRASRSCSTPTNTQPPNHPTTQSLLLLLCLLCGHSNFRCRHRLLFVKNDLSSIFGVPCRSAEDVNWLNESLHPELSDAEAREFFQCDHRPHSATGSLFQTLGQKPTCPESPFHVAELAGVWLCCRGKIFSSMENFRDRVFNDVAHATQH